MVKDTADLLADATAVIVRGAVSALARGCRPLNVTLAVNYTHAQKLLGAFARTSLQHSLPTASQTILLGLLTPSIAPTLACAFPALRRLCLCLFLPATASDRLLPAAQALALLRGSGTGTGHGEQQPAEAGGQGLGGAESSAAPCGLAAAGGSAPGPAQSEAAAAGLEPFPSAAVTIPPLQPGRPGLAGLRELELSSDGVVPPPLLAPLLGSLAVITQLELTEGLVSAVHITSLQPLTQLRRLSLQAIELRVGGEPDGLTALLALTHLAVSAIAMRGPPVDANWIELNDVEQELSMMGQWLPSCELPSRLEVLALGSGPYFYAYYITSLTSLQQLYAPNTLLILDPGLSQLTGLTQLVVRDLLSLPGPDGPDLAEPLQPCALPPRLPCLTLTGEGGAWYTSWGDPNPPKPLGHVGLLTGTEHLTRLEDLNERSRQMPMGSLTGLVGLKELDLPWGTLLGPGSLSALTALTLLRVYRLVVPSPKAAAAAAEAAAAAAGADAAGPPPPPPENATAFELPPNLQLLTVGSIAGGFDSNLDVLVEPTAARWTCARGPARLHIGGGGCQSRLAADLLLGLAGLRELEAPGVKLCLGPAGLSAHASLTAINVQALVFPEGALEASACGADERSVSLLPPRLEQLLLSWPLKLAELAALGRALEGLRSPPSENVLVFEEGKDMAPSGELLSAAQDTVCKAARFLAALAEPPTQFSLGVWKRKSDAPDDPDLESSAPRPRLKLLPVGSMAASAAGAGDSEGSVPPSHAPWLAALGGMSLRQLKLWSVSLSPGDMRALATHMPQLQVLALGLPTDLHDFSTLPLLAGLRHLETLELRPGACKGRQAG
ncbi:hypothetical protein HYH03_009542 [Edaphochlamys debaryana]|uniref:Uncharacterized protein n=1 Tax=Edaphochlamys debaryana TaxID=47281 RepID=A0A835XWA8_9CHLO|nr:hypothetical protein HYH03_009542 [Edaphochlamys debaryana]|eukprot:KAG2492302.1 hypothetical protein HYH03_009542 [Edaphochlamys debaryana]